jgi:hypothetical protein
MTAPLSLAQNSSRALASGMFGGQKQVIAPRGSYVVQGVGDPAMGYDGTPGYAWNVMPGLIGGLSDFGQVSTDTGVPVGTPEVPDEGKVGGGPIQAQVPDYGGTAAY